MCIFESLFYRFQSTVLSDIQEVEAGGFLWVQDQAVLHTFQVPGQPELLREEAHKTIMGMRTFHMEINWSKYFVVIKPASYFRVMILTYDLNFMDTH